MYDFETVAKMAEGSIRNPQTTVRVNLSNTELEPLKESLTSEGIQVEESSYLPNVLKISGYDSLSRIKAFKKGLIQVQDESSATVGHIADPDGDAFVLDMCSAPGGKALHAADVMRQKGGTGRVLARDVSEHKISLIEDNVERCGFTNIETEVYDGTVLDESLVGKADLVICDVPCSGLGILARKNDIKYNVTKERIEELVPLQRAILANAAAYVKPGGTLIFSTCTITKEENEENRRWLLEEFPLETVDFSDRLPEYFSEQAKEGYLQLLPGIYGTDGFYIAKFRRV
jgi:16S rRNA (cytosine967-C5)-methyltransferase